jgi:hypothetical protein
VFSRRLQAHCAWLMSAVASRRKIRHVIQPRILSRAQAGSAWKWLLATDGNCIFDVSSVGGGAANAKIKK